MRNLQTERSGRFGRHLVRTLFHGHSLPMPRGSRRDLSGLPRILRPTGAPLCILAAMPRVLSPQRPAETSVWFMRGQDMLGHSGCLRRFHGSHEGHCPGLFSSRDGRAGRRGVVLVGSRRDALPQSQTGIRRPQPFSAGFHDADSGWTRQPDAEQTHCEVPMMPPKGANVAEQGLKHALLYRHHRQLNRREARATQMRRKLKPRDFLKGEWQRF